MYLHTDHCSEFELRDAMHALYPHRHEASMKHHKSMFENRETRWNTRVHHNIQMSIKHVEDIHSHPCIHKVIPLYYEKLTADEMLFEHHRQSTTHEPEVYEQMEKLWQQGMTSIGS